MKRSEKTATRKPAKWRGLTKGSLIYLFFCRVREDFETDTTRGVPDESNKYTFGMSIKSLMADEGGGK